VIIILPFVLALVAAVYGMRGRRGAAIAWWAVTLVVNLPWLWYHMTDTLKLDF
jgi:hypothetical protein